MILIFHAIARSPMAEARDSVCKNRVIASRPAFGRRSNPRPDQGVAVPTSVLASVSHIIGDARP
jgi:hypothetical protein